MAFHVGNNLTDLHDSSRFDRGLEMVGPREKADQRHEMGHCHKAVTVRRAPVGKIVDFGSMTLLKPHRSPSRQIPVKLILDRLR